MKRIVALVLALCMALSLCACGDPIATQTQTQTGGQTVTSGGETPVKTKEVNIPTVSKPLTWDRINAIPIPTAEMSTDELRQTVVDYMRLQMEFQWTPNESFEFLIAYHSRMNVFPAGQVYAGLPYDSPNTSGGGNLYNVMNYYDENTGVLDVKSIGGNKVGPLLGTHCSSSTLWAWSRVVNTAKCYSRSENGVFYGGMENGKMIQKYGFLTVGPYTYDKDLESWWVGDGTKAVTETNGDQIIYQSYAAMLPADGLITLVSSIPDRKINHLQLLAKAPEVKYNPDGTIDGENSFLTVMEQTSVLHPTKDDDGTIIQVQGGVDARFSFKDLFEAYYLPFTFAEFHKQDPVEKGEASFALPEGETAVTFENLSKGYLYTNYAICEIFLSVKDSTGKEVYQRNTISHLINNYQEKGSQIFLITAKKHITSGNTVNISVRLNNGEIVQAYEATV